MFAKHSSFLTGLFAIFAINCICVTVCNIRHLFGRCVLWWTGGVCNIIYVMYTIIYLTDVLWWTGGCGSLPSDIGRRPNIKDTEDLLCSSYLYICSELVNELGGWLPKHNTDVGKDVADFSVLFLHIWWLRSWKHAPPRPPWPWKLSRMPAPSQKCSEFDCYPAPPQGFYSLPRPAPTRIFFCLALPRSKKRLPRASLIKKINYRMTVAQTREI